jgi:ADP-dependent NAD(P)H-hydrate dehydratase
VVSTRDTQVITPRLLREWALPVPDGGKDSRGVALVIGGSRYTPGAVLLAGIGALRAGAGVLQLAVAGSTAAALSIEVPEALVIGMPETETGSVRGPLPERLTDLVRAADAIALGPGLDDVDETTGLLRAVLDLIGPRTGLVLDAYALGALSREPALLRAAPAPVVLTPNLTEARYLLGRDPGPDLDEESAALARRYGAVVSLYGHIATPDGRTFREESGHVGLGTSGSGDARAGILLGLLSRGVEPAQAACWAAYAHAMSGQRLASRIGPTGFLAREILSEVPPVLHGV